ncbi:MAG TPA: glycosyltransferase family 4 protein [Candidatus Omnitrophota bacterium]|nr:glycosyltransferase family 4 protein [Candidatus Omnitrophota bacterium]
MRPVSQIDGMTGRQGRYLLLLRFFSGLRELENGRWLPYGSPTISRLIEGLEKKSIEATVVLVCGEPGQFKHARKPLGICVDGFRHVRFVALPFVRFTGIGCLDCLLNDIKHFFYCVRLAWKLRPALVYCVRATQVAGAFLTLCGFSVALRMMGAAIYYPFFRNRWNRFKHPLFYGSMRARFACIIASIDGSAIRPLLEGFAHPRARKQYLINGVERADVPARRAFAPGQMRILFVARFEDQKGTQELLVALRMLAAGRRDFQATLVGYGGSEELIRDQIRRQGLEGLAHIAGKVAHSRIMEAYMSHEIFVSLNRLGNLNNTVLEAMAAGCCTLMLGRGEDGVDADTERIIPADACVRVSRKDTAADLAGALKRLLDSAATVEEYSGKALRWAAEAVPTWEQRIEYELNLLEEVCAG